MADDQRDFWKQRHSSVEGIRAVGCISISEEDNEAEYAEAKAFLSELLNTRLRNPSRTALLDLGYGQGHYARMAAELQIGTYVGLDFAAPHLEMKGDYHFRCVDICDPELDLEQMFDVILLIDVAFHVVDDIAFVRLIENVRRHALDTVIVTGLFKHKRIAAHVLHRSMDQFTRLGGMESIHSWRGTRLAVFRLSWWVRVYRKTLNRLRRLQ